MEVFLHLVLFSHHSTGRLPRPTTIPITILLNKRIILPSCNLRSLLVRSKLLLVRRQGLPMHTCLLIRHHCLLIATNSRISIPDRPTTHHCLSSCTPPQVSLQLPLATSEYHASRVAVVLPFQVAVRAGTSWGFLEVRFAPEKGPVRAEFVDRCACKAHGWCTAGRDGQPSVTASSRFVGCCATHCASRYCRVGFSNRSLVFVSI